MAARSIDVILQQIRKKEEEDAAYKKRIKECELIIKTEENNIKELKAIKTKLTEDYETKLSKNCKLEVDKEIFEQQNKIWTDLLSENRKDLEKEETNLEEIQQSVFQNRTSFCDNMLDYLNKHDWLKMAHQLPKTSLTPLAASFIVKTEKDDEECTNLMETIKCLEIESNDLDIKLSQIEQAKQLKSKLSCEPSSGNEFIRLQKSIQDVNLKVRELDEQIESIKKEISQKDLLIFNQSKLRDLHKLNQYEQRNNDKNSVNASSDSCSTSTIKVVKFNDAVQTKNITPSPPKSDSKGSNVMNHSKYKPQLPRNTLLAKKRSHQEISSKLDEEMMDILFSKK